MRSMGRGWWLMVIEPIRRGGIYIMKCPYCDKEMLQGYIHNGNQPVQWLPNNSKPSPLRFSTADDGVALINQFRINGYKAQAYYCSNCNLVIARTEK